MSFKTPWTRYSIHTHLIVDCVKALTEWRNQTLLNKEKKIWMKIWETKKKSVREEKAMFSWFGVWSDQSTLSMDMQGNKKLNRWKHFRLTLMFFYYGLRHIVGNFPFQPFLNGIHFLYYPYLVEISCSQFAWKSNYSFDVNVSIYLRWQWMNFILPCNFVIRVVIFFKSPWVFVVVVLFETAYIPKSLN